MSKEFWGKSALSSEVRRNNSKIILPAFSANCGQLNASVQFKGSGTAATSHPANGPYNPFTVEFWINPTGGLKFVAKEHANYSFYAALKSNLIVEFGVYDGLGASVILNSGVQLVTNTWQHVALTRSYAAGTTTIKFYLNGILAYTGTTVAIGVDYATDATWTFGGSVADGTLFSGHMGEMRVWSDVRSADNILYGYNKRLGYPSNATLKLRFDCSEGSGTNLIDRGSSVADPIVINGTTVLFDTVVYPPVIYGASFIAAKFNVAALSDTDNLSLKFPVKPPAECNFGLAVSWTDPLDDTFKRRLLWNPDADLGVLDIVPALALYNGERLPPTFDIEVWNIDGFATCDLEDDLDIKLSITSTPTNSVDLDNVSLGTLTKDSTLAQNFPLTPFPLTFSVQQVYT